MPKENIDYIKKKIKVLKDSRMIYKEVIFDNSVNLLQQHETFGIDVDSTPLSNYLDSVQMKIQEFDKSIKILEDDFTVKEDQ